MKMLLFPIASIILSSCSAAIDSKDLGGQANSAVLYGGESREEITPKSNSADLAKATAILIDAQKLKRSNENILLLTSPLKEHYPLCEDELFQEQPVLGFCSGVLVAPNKVLTAGHCISKERSCTDLHFAFGWDRERAEGSTLNAKDLYSCKQVIVSQNQISKSIDYAIIELDRAVINANPVTLASEDGPLENETLLSLSYPLGLPIKQDLGSLIENLSYKNTFVVAVDTFEGSSGSPLFNSKGQLIGILSKGMDDILEDDIYRIQTYGGCINFNRCKKGTCYGESFFKTSRIPKEYL